MKRTRNREDGGPSLMQTGASQWDFSSIPDSELEACWWYEFGRESDRIRSALEKLQAETDQKAARAIELWMAPAPAWLFRELFDFFPEIPWQGIPQAKRQSIAKALGKNRQKSRAHFIVEDLAAIKDVDEFWRQIQPTSLSRWLGPNRRKFLIELNFYDNPKTAAGAFEKWYRKTQKSMRGTHKMPSKKRRADLRALGAVRVLRNFKTERKSDEIAIQESQDFTEEKSHKRNPIYRESKDWYRAKVRVKIVIAELVNKKLVGASFGEPSAQ